MTATATCPTCGKFLDCEAEEIVRHIRTCGPAHAWAELSEPEERFASLCEIVRLRPEREYRFHPERKWRFDFAWPEHMLAVEIDGGAWTGGRHVRGSGFTRDCEKMTEAALMGWRVLRLTPKMVTIEVVNRIAAVVAEGGSDESGR